MRKRRKVPSSNVNATAARIVKAIGDLNIGNIGQKNPAAVALGRLGGQRGGLARAQKLSSEQRREIARNAAVARWKKRGADN